MHLTSNSPNSLSAEESRTACGPLPAKGVDYQELAQLININSYTKNKAGVDEVAALYSSWMEAIGFTTKTYQRSHIGNHVLYRSSTEKQAIAGKRVLLLGHFDTVFPPNTFEGFRQDEDWIYGPGVCDMKGGNYVALQALRNVKRQLGEITNIDVLMVSDEESGSDDSKALTKSIATNYDLCLVFEAAGPKEDIVIARKGIATYTIEITGKAAHAGNHFTDGVDANLAAAHLVIALNKLTNNAAGSTVNAGKIKGGIGANTISPQASILVEARFTSTDEKQRVLSQIENIANACPVNHVNIKISGGLQRDVMQTNNRQVELIQTLETITGVPFKLERRGGVSDANVVAGVGVPTLDGFGPYGDGDHTVNERANKHSLIKRIELVTQILLHYSKTTQPTIQLKDESLAIRLLE